MLQICLSVHCLLLYYIGSMARNIILLKYYHIIFKQMTQRVVLPAFILAQARIQGGGRGAYAHPILVGKQYN